MYYMSTCFTARSIAIKYKINYIKIRCPISVVKISCNSKNLN